MSDLSEHCMPPSFLTDRERAAWSLGYLECKVFADSEICELNNRIKDFEKRPEKTQKKHENFISLDSHGMPAGDPFHPGRM